MFICLILLVPIVPFVFFHQAVERWVSGLVQAPPGPWTVAALVVGLLGTDVLLPIPSSLVSTLAGGQLPAWVAILASWTGLNLGAAVGFWAGRTGGRALAERLADPSDLQQMQRVAQPYAATALVVTRALPILAEATVLLLGVQGIAWRRFWPPVLLSNLGIAIAYSALGHYAGQQEWLAVALSISVALPLLATWWIRRRLNRECGALK
jgi:membrane protein DedA with SNARE-associated domain